MVKAASAIIIKNKKILLVKRSNYTNVFPNTWACPGGRANSNETPKEAVIREVKEEVNLDFIPKKLFKTGNYEGRELFRFIGDFSGNIILQNDELTDFSWFSYSDAIKLDLGFDYKELIEMLHRENLI